MITTRTGQKITRAQLRRALSRYRNGRASLSELERDLGVENYRGKFLRRAWESELGITDVKPKKVTENA